MSWWLHTISTSIKIDDSNSYKKEKQFTEKHVPKFNDQCGDCATNPFI